MTESNPKPTIIHRKAGNWVDRGEPTAWLVERILSPDELAAFEEAGLDSIRDAD